MEETEPRVQQLFHGLYLERGIGSQDLANAGFCVLFISIYIDFHPNNPMKYVLLIALGLIALIIVLSLLGALHAKSLWYKDDRQNR
jgi:hypothetical protein